MIEFWIDDVRDFESVMGAIENADVVFHAAAMKQVSTCECFPSQAVVTNVIGAENVVRAARPRRAHTVVAMIFDELECPLPTPISASRRRTSAIRSARWLGAARRS